MSPSIRRGTVDDVPAVLDLWVALMANGTAADGRYVTADAAVDAMRSYIRNDWLSGRYPFPALWVADADGLVGYVSITVVVANPVLAAAPTARIGDLYVLPGWRRRGLGGALVARAREAASAAGYARHQVGTLVRDTRAVGFWRSQGFDDLFVTLIAEPGATR